MKYLFMIGFSFFLVASKPDKTVLPPAIQDLITLDSKQKKDSGDKVAHPIYGLHDGRRSFGGPLFPVGFSKDGKFAYVDHLSSGGCFCTSFTIVDLVTDKEMYSLTREDNVTSFIKTHWPELKKNLNKYKIDLTGRPPVNKFPLKHKGSVYRVDLNKKSLPKAQKDCSWNKQLDVEFYKFKFRKTVATYKLCDEYSISPNEVVGYVASPFEQRVAIILREESRGFEAELTRMNLVAGASLTVGFK